MTITRDTIDQARTILDEGRAAHCVVPSPDVNLLDVLGASVNLTSLIPHNALYYAVHYLIGQLPAFQAITDALEGDPASITAHCDAVEAAGSGLGDGLGLLTAGARTARQQWTGEAAEEFSRTIISTADVYQALAGIPPVIAELEQATGTYVGTVRDLVRQGVHELIDAVVIAFAAALPATLLSAAGGGIVGGTAGLVDGFVDGWNSGGAFGALGGAWDGMTQGAAQGAVAAAVASVTAWANLLVADYLEHFANLLTALTSTCAEAMGHVRGLGQSMVRAAALLDGRPDPGPVMDTSDGSYADQLGGAAPQAADVSMAQLNELFPWSSDMTAENAPLVPIPGTNPPQYYRPLTESEISALGIDPSLLNDRNGFTAGLAAVTDEHGDVVQPPKLVVVMGGSTDGDQYTQPVDEDWIEDGIGAVSVSQQSANAIALATEINNKGYGNSSVYTGHSLGGRLAAVAAMSTGSTAVTFNSAGVSDPTYQQIATMTGTTPDQVRAASLTQVRSYQTSDDPLTWAQQGMGAPMDGMLHDAAGTRIRLDGTTLGGTYGVPVGGHGTDNVVAAMGNAGTVDGWSEVAANPVVPQK